MFFILTKVGNFCITEHNAGVLLRIGPLKFNYDPAECSHGLQKAACLGQSLTRIWNNCMRPMFFHYDLSFIGCLCQYIFFLRVLLLAFLWYLPFSHYVLFPARVFGYPHHRLVCFHATSPVIHFKDILWFPSYSILACSQYPSPKFAIVSLQVLHTFSGYSVFHLPVCIHVQPIFLW